MEFLFFFALAIVAGAIGQAMRPAAPPQQRQPQTTGPSLLGTAAAVAGGMIVGDMVSDAMADEPAAETIEAPEAPEAPDADMGGDLDFGSF